MHTGRPRSSFLVATLVVLGTSLPLHARAAKTAFRLTDLDWRDPHFFTTVAFLSCTDVTNLDSFGILGINPYMQSGIENDVDEDGNLDLNYLIVFDPLDQQGSGGTLAFGGGTCTAPAGTTCTSEVLPGYSYSNVPGSCLDILAGTTNALYTPAIVVPSSPCFVAALGTLVLDIAGIPVMLTDAYLAATYSGDPATGLVNGLIRGFMSEAVANATIVPPQVQVGANEPISMMWRGGNNCCSQPAPATGDKDIGPGGVTGWYVYLNFTATVVTYDEPTGVGDTPPSSLTLDAPVPNPFNPSTAIRYSLAHRGPVTLDVYDASGRRVAQLESAVKSAGVHETTWNGITGQGAVASSGVYFLRLSSRGETRVQKLVLVK